MTQKGMHFICTNSLIILNSLTDNYYHITGKDIVSIYFFVP